MTSISSAAPDNSLLSDSRLPDFSHFTAAEVVPAVSQLIAAGRATLASVLAAIAAGAAPTWDNLVAPLEEADDRLSKAWAPVGHLHGVANNDALREAYAEAQALLTDYGTEVSQNENLYAAYVALAASPAYADLSAAQQQAITHALRDFTLAGVGLAADQKARYGEIKKRLSELTTQFSNNVLDATKAWYLHRLERADLAGLPDAALAQAQAAAAQKSLDGYVITLDFPAYYAVMLHAEDRALRQKLYTAYVTRASELGSDAGGALLPALDNTPLIAEIVALRHELANLVGFSDYATRSLATKMAESPAQVFDFLNLLASKARPAAVADLAELRAFAKDHGVADLQAWDVTYFSEKLREEKYAISEEAIKPYFPFEHVLVGLFTTVERLFGVQVRQVENPDVYHPDVRFFEIFSDGTLIASFYLDAFARENKRGGAWMDDCRVRRKRGQEMQLPVAFLVGNFAPAVSGQPAQLTHDEVITLFHEFGHGLHHMLTQIDVAAVSGINGVAWDAVELPSQFMENWCWQPQALRLLSKHVDTGEPLPDALLEKMLAAKNFQSGLFLMRQLEFALFDFYLHADYCAHAAPRARDVLQAVRERIAVVKAPEFNRFETSFSHIFAGGYAAGYYSYLWAEVLSADAFSAFEAAGIFDRATGERFKTCVLAQGGSRPAMELFTQFRGRAPDVQALLRHSGLTEEAA